MDDLLPPEVLSLIFCALDARSLGRCARVCRHWRDVSRDAPLWREAARGALLASLETWFIEGGGESSEEAARGALGLLDAIGRLDPNACFAGARLFGLDTGSSIDGDETPDLKAEPWRRWAGVCEALVVGGGGGDGGGVAVFDFGSSSLKIGMREPRPDLPVDHPATLKRRFDPEGRILVVIY